MKLSQAQELIEISPDDLIMSTDSSDIGGDGDVWGGTNGTTKRVTFTTLLTWLINNSKDSINSINASSYSGNLTPSANSLQLLADAVDALTVQSTDAKVWAYKDSIPGEYKIIPNGIGFMQNTPVVDPLSFSVIDEPYMADGNIHGTIINGNLLADANRVAGVRFEDPINAQYMTIYGIGDSGPIADIVPGTSITVCKSVDGLNWVEIVTIELETYGFMNNLEPSDYDSQWGLAVDFGAIHSGNYFACRINNQDINYDGGEARMSIAEVQVSDFNGADIGDDNDYAFTSINGNLYLKESNVWKLFFNYEMYANTLDTNNFGGNLTTDVTTLQLLGEAVDQLRLSESAMFVASGGPATNLGDGYDWYVDTNTGRLWSKDDFDWGEISFGAGSWLPIGGTNGELAVDSFTGVGQGWISTPNEFPSEWGWDFGDGNGQVVNRFDLYRAMTDGELISGTFQGTNDLNKWENIGNFNFTDEETNPFQYNTVEFINHNTEYRYYRLKINSVEDGYESAVIRELKFFTLNDISWEVKTPQTTIDDSGFSTHLLNQTITNSQDLADAVDSLNVTGREDVILKGEGKPKSSSSYNDVYVDLLTGYKWVNDVIVNNRIDLGTLLLGTATFTAQYPMINVMEAVSGTLPGVITDGIQLSATQNENWMELDFGEGISYAIELVRLWKAPLPANNNIDNITISTSGDGETWINVNSINIQADTTDGFPIDIPIPKSIATRYIRMTSTSTTPSIFSYLDIEMYENVSYEWSRKELLIPNSILHGNGRPNEMLGYIDSKYINLDSGSVYTKNEVTLFDKTVSDAYGTSGYNESTPLKAINGSVTDLYQTYEREYTEMIFEFSELGNNCIESIDFKQPINEIPIYLGIDRFWVFVSSTDDQDWIKIDQEFIFDDYQWAQTFRFQNLLTDHRYLKLVLKKHQAVDYIQIGHIEFSEISQVGWTETGSVNNTTYYGYSIPNINTSYVPKNGLFIIDEEPLNIEIPATLELINEALYAPEPNLSASTNFTDRHNGLEFERAMEVSRLDISGYPALENGIKNGAFTPTSLSASSNIDIYISDDNITWELYETHVADTAIINHSELGEISYGLMLTNPVITKYIKLYGELPLCQDDIHRIWIMEISASGIDNPGWVNDVYIDKLTGFTYIKVSNDEWKEEYAPVVDSGGGNLNFTSRAEMIAFGDATSGQIATIEGEQSNQYTYDTSLNKWCVKYGNMYSNATMPTQEEDLSVHDHTLIINYETGSTFSWMNA